MTVLIILYIFITGLINAIKVHDKHCSWQYSFEEQWAYFVIGFLTGFIITPFYLICGLYKILRSKLK